MSKWVAKRDDGNHGHDEGRHRWGMLRMRRHWGAWVIPQQGRLSTVIPEYPRYSGILVQVMTI